MLKSETNVIYFDENFEKLKQVIKQNAPFSKVLLIAFKNEFILKGKIITEKLKENGNKVISCVFDDDFVFSLEKISGVFNAPEDVRIIVSLNDRLSSLAYYFAHIKNISAVVLTNCWKDVLGGDKLFIKNGESLDEFYCEAKRFVLLEKPFLSDIEAYSFVWVEKFNLLDVYLTSIYCDFELDKKAFNQYEKALDELEKVLLGEVYVDNRLKFMLSVIEKGIVLRSSLPIKISTAIGVIDFFFECDYVQKLFVAKRILSCVDKTLKQNHCEIFSYRESALQVSALTGFSEVAVLNNFLTQTSGVNKNKSPRIFEQCIRTFCKRFNQSIVNVKKLGIKGVRLESKCTRLIKICGDTPLGVNFLSVLREIN